MTGHNRMSLLDACSDYNQIKLETKDEEHKSFITPRGMYCYTVMPFGLKNVGATFQRPVNQVFRRLIDLSTKYVFELIYSSSRYAQSNG